MKHPLTIFLQDIASWYWQISTHKITKIQLLGTQIHSSKFYQILGVENEVSARKTEKIKDSMDQISCK